MSEERLCGECNESVLAGAKACPNCGAVLQRSRRALFWFVLLVAVGGLLYTQVSLFVIPPIGAIPEGRTVVMLRGGGMKFIDSPDAMCERIQGGVSLLCRGMVMASAVEEGTILLRLPYVGVLYSISTGGRSYDR